MSLFNALYTLGGCRTKQPIQNMSSIEVNFDDQSACARATRWAKWFVTFPLQTVHGAYNTVFMLATKNINKVIESQIYSGNEINYLPFIGGKSGHVVTSPKAIKAITTHFRDDVDGPFERDKEDPFTPILKDLYPEESVGKDDFLFTCSRAHVNSFRNPLLEYVGPKALSRLRDQIDEVTKEVLNAFTNNEFVTAKDLAETYTVAILARLFLNHPGTLKDFQAIGSAVIRVTEYQFIKKWGKPSDAQCKQYFADLQTLRDAILHSRGEFVDSLKKAGLSLVQIKGELLLVYAAGSETTASSLQYILWRLGQDPKLQAAVRNNSEAALKFVEECMLQYTPVTVFSRFARKDLVISVQNKNGKIWKYPIAKGEALVMAPHLAKNAIFGGGKHICPGQWLARAEMASLVSALATRYAITSSPEKRALATIPGLGFLKVEPVNLTLRK